MRVNVIHLGGNAVEPAEPQARLQAVIDRIGACFLLIDVKEVAGWPGNSKALNSVGQVRRSNRRLTRLIDVPKTEELGSLCAYIPKLGNGFIGNLPLDIQIEILNVWRSNVGVDAEEVSQRCRTRIHRSVRGQWRSAQISKRDRRRSDS